MLSVRNHNALSDKPMDIGNCLIYRESVERHTHTVNQLGCSLLYSKGDDEKMKQSSHQSYLITWPAEMLSLATAAK